VFRPTASKEREAFVATKKRQPFALAKEDNQDTFFGEQPKNDNQII
jgi:hypothetical protein